MLKPRPWIPVRKYLTLNQPRRQLVGDLLCNHGILVPLSDCWCGSAAPDFFWKIWRRSETGRAPWTVRLKAAMIFWDTNIIGGFNTHTDIYIYIYIHYIIYIKMIQSISVHDHFVLRIPSWLTCCFRMHGSTTAQSAVTRCRIDWFAPIALREVA